MSEFSIRETVTQTTQKANADLGELFNKWFKAHGPDAIFRTCNTCKHMPQNAPAHCALYQMTPPASVIIAGCPSHEDAEEIPF
ncbi:hypothetical protein [Aminobacter phage Erebus]|nr:hypothetical protein [Aminobacter phage Erebus]